MLQYSVTPQDSVQAGYVGSVGRHIEAFAGTNNPSKILPPGTPITPYIAFPDFANGSSYDITAGSSSYNSLQTKYEHRLVTDCICLAVTPWPGHCPTPGELIE